MRTIKILLCVLLCFVFCGCESVSAPVSTADISEYLKCFINMDYASMFNHTSPVVEIDKQAFVKRYGDIFSGLGVKQIVINSITGPSDEGVFTYTATYKTKEYGEFTNDYTLRTEVIKDKTMVLWDYSLIFPEMETGFRVKVKTLKADRGEIFAANGAILAKNAFAATLYMNTSKVQDIVDVAEAVGSLTDKTNTEIIELFNKAQEDGNEIVVLGAYFADELTDEQKQSVLSVPGLGIDTEMYTPIRDYPMKEYTAHMLGYMGYYEEGKVPEGYTISDKAGLSGLEASYEKELRGSDGKIIYIENEWGKNIRTLYEVPCSQGQDLRLTIKPMLQKRAYDALTTYLDVEKEQTGAAIIIDASTGYVEAMASYPSFDNNLFTFGLSQENLDAFKKYESLFARTTQGRYPPGSVIKPFVASIALDKGAVTEDTVFKGEIVDDTWTPEIDGWNSAPPIKRVEYHGSEGPLTLHNGLTKSDNIYFAYAALELGEQSLIDYYRRIGLEEAVPFDLPLKKANIVNSTSSIPKRLLAEMGYGQGQLLVTPVQMAAMYTAFANKTGDMLKPIIVQKLCQTDGLDYKTLTENKKEVWVENAVSKRSLDILTPILEQVVRHGTAYPVKMPGVDIAGKTGTAEIGNNKSREISWFAGYWLDGSYDRLVIVMVDVATDEGPVKFDIAKELLTP